MDENKKHILNLIIDLWQTKLLEGDNGELFEIWVEENIENEEQMKIFNAVKNHVDAITCIMDDIE